MLDWLAVGWNMAMTVSGSVLVSQSARQWPLVFNRASAAVHTGLTILLGLLLAVYPAPLIPAAEHLGNWTGHFGDLRYTPLVGLMLAYRPGWAFVAGLIVTVPQIVWGAVHSQPAEALVPLLALAGVLLMAATMKRHLDFMTVSLVKALQLTPLIFLPAGLGYFYTLGWPQGTVPALVLTVFNVTAFLAGMLVLRSRFRLLALSARLSQQAHTDPLTGLWNRRQLEYDLSGLAVGAHILVVDLDYFKTINDRFGHDVGDEYLVSAAAALNRALASADVRRDGRTARRRRWVRNQTSTAAAEQAYRLGGEEFALLLPSSPEKAAALADSVMTEIRGVRHRINPGGQITCSVGVARRSEGESPQDTQRRADMALMHAKANGRDRSEVAGPLAEMLSQTKRKQNVRPAQPLLWEAINASLSLAALDRDLTPEDWTRLLQAAILSVPGAESGTIDVRRGGRYVLCAQLGFDDRLLGLSHSRLAQVDWHGLGENAWKAGKPRVLSGPQIAAQSQGEGSLGEAQSQEFAVYGRVNELQASLCIPVTMEGEVVGHLNLDRSSDNRPFDEEDLRVARAFADQVTVLMVSDRRRRRQERQRREQDWLLEFGLELLRTTDREDIAGRLLRGLASLSGIQGQVVLGEQGLPAETLEADAQRVRTLPWPGPVPARLVLWRQGEFSPQDLQLIDTATRIADAALANLKPRVSTPG